jgi:hypothetical protein
MTMKTKEVVFQFRPFEQGVVMPEPEWKSKIDRWYQLDETSFSFCEALYSWEQTDQMQRFDQIIYVCEQASNAADADFVASGALSPSKFIYTLPSIGPSVVAQLLNWYGPVYCFPVTSTLDSTMNLAYKMAENRMIKFKQSTLILQNSPCLNKQGFRTVKGYFVYAG